MPLDKKVFFALAALPVLQLSLSTRAMGATLYGDTFSRGTPAAPVPLFGSTPTVDPSGATWTGSTNYTTDGTEAVLSTIDDDSYLPLSVSTGGAYTLSATLNPGSSQFVTLGFTGGMSQGFIGNAGPGTPNSPVFVLYKQGGAIESYSGGGLKYNPGDGQDTLGGAPDTFTITLDTTGGNLAATPFTISATGFAASGTVDLSAATGIPVTGISISVHDDGSAGTTGGTGFVSNLLLTGPVTTPEPASLALLAFGGLGLLARRRRSL